MIKNDIHNTCLDCGHECHCENLVCVVPVGIGITDKTQPCKCGVCRCSNTQQGKQ